MIIPDSVTSINDVAFKGCTSLASVTIPDSVTSIGLEVFVETALYNDDSNWEDNVLYIGHHLIKANEEIEGEYSIKEGTLTIADGAFYECSSLTSVTIPDTVTSIGYSAFDNCSDLTSVTIPDSVTSIGDYVFNMCSSLASVDIPNSVTSIGYSAFEGCSSLTSIIIPGSVTSIGGSAFEDCSSLNSIKVENDNPANISLGEDVFYVVPTETCVLHVPEGSKELYASSPQWEDFDNIEEFQASGIEEVAPVQQADPAAPYYDLSGRRVANPTRGFYIHGGKKVLVK